MLSDDFYDKHNLDPVERILVDGIAAQAVAESTFKECGGLMQAGNYRAVIDKTTVAIDLLEKSEGAKQFMAGALFFFYGTRGACYHTLSKNIDRNLLSLALRDTKQALDYGSRLSPEELRRFGTALTASRASLKDIKRLLAGDSGADASGNQKKDKCFVATAAYGSAFAPDVVTLRRFRDARLKKNRLGRWVIHVYEHYSPPLADAIAPHPMARLWVRRLVLSPVVWLVRRLTEQ